MLSFSILIDIDTAWKFCFTSVKECYNYGDLNYVVYKYIVRLNIQQLTTKQQEKFVEDSNILKDIENCKHLEPIDLECNNSDNKKQNFA